MKLLAFGNKTRSQRCHVSWIQDVNWTYIRHSEDIQDVFRTSFIRSFCNTPPPSPPLAPPPLKKREVFLRIEFCFESFVPNVNIYTLEIMFLRECKNITLVFLQVLIKFPVSKPYISLPPWKFSVKEECVDEPSGCWVESRCSHKKNYLAISHLFSFWNSDEQMKNITCLFIYKCNTLISNTRLILTKKSIKS